VTRALASRAAPGRRTALARERTRAEPDVLALQRTAGNAAVTQMIQRYVLDQHAGAKQPNSAQTTQIQSELNPATSAKPGVTGAWDGAGDMYKQMELHRELTAALIAHMDKATPEMKAREGSPRVPIASFEGVGRGAKKATDDRFGGWASAGALTATQQHDRASFAWKADRNLIDATDPRYNVPNPDFLVGWIVRNDPAATKATKAHSFDPDRREERDWLDTTIVQPFVSVRRRDLERYWMYGFGMSPSDTMVFIPPVIYQPGVSGDRPAAGGPSPAERKTRWEMWAVLVHEYIHTLEHPAFGVARRNNDILKEGFTHMFTEEVLNDWSPKAKADKDPALRGDVEGTDPKGKPWPGFQPGIVPVFDPFPYEEHVAHAKRIRAILGNDTGLKAAFFQGHVEFLGLTPGGAVGGSGRTPGEVDLPPGVATFGEAAALTGVSAMELAASNPMLREPFGAGTRLHALGTRWHTVVESTGRYSSTGTDKAAETIEQIGLQNGVSPPMLRRANPGLDFAKLKAGDLVLIPKR
jgi:hypothetical protein